MELILIVTSFLCFEGVLSQATWWKKHAAQLSCSEPGYFVNPADCHKFYRCVDRSTWSSPKLVRYDFDCPNGMAFDTSVSVCSTPGPSGCAEPWWNTQPGGNGGDGGEKMPPSPPGPPAGGFWGNRPDSDEGFDGAGGNNLDGFPNRGTVGFGGGPRPAKSENSGSPNGPPGMPNREGGGMQSGEKPSGKEPADADDGFLDLGGDNENENEPGGNSFGSPPDTDGDKQNDGFLDLGGDVDGGGNNAGINRPPGGNLGGNESPLGMNRPDGGGVRGPFGGRGPGSNPGRPGLGSNADVDPLDIDFGSSVENGGPSGSNELGNNNSDDRKSDNSDADSQAGDNDNAGIDKQNDNDDDKGGNGRRMDGGSGQNQPMENSLEEPNKDDPSQAFWVGAKPGLGQMSVPSPKPPPRQPTNPQVICRPGSCNSNTGQGSGGPWGNNPGQGFRPGGSNNGANWGQGGRPGSSANWGGASRPSVPESSSTWRPTGMWGSPSNGEFNSTPAPSFDAASNESPNTDSGGNGGPPRDELSWWGPPPPRPVHPSFGAPAPYPFRPRYPAYQIVAYPTWPGPYGSRPILVVYSNSKK
ncbi:unnamed protein product [Orchesella dallaii]